MRSSFRCSSREASLKDEVRGLSAIKLKFFLAWRFLFSRHRSGFVRLLTYLSISSVGLALAAFVIVLAVMNGFDRDLRGRIVGGIGAVRGFSITGEIAYTPEIEKTILETPGVTAVTPEVKIPGLLRGPHLAHGLPATSEAEVTGVLLSRKIQTSPLERQLAGHSALPAAGEILLGTALAEKLGADIGDTIAAILIFSSAAPAFAGDGTPKEADYRVSGIYRTGYYEIDVASAILPIEPLRQSLGLHAALAHTLEIAVAAPDEAHIVTVQLQERLSKSGLFFRSWKDMREPLFRAIKLEKLVMGMILSLFGLIAVFSVLSALISTAVEKRRELAALRAMGMSRSAVASVLLMAGVIAGGLGLVLGAALSAGGHLLITQSDFFRLPPDIYDLDRLPSEWSTPIFAGSASVLFCLSLLSACIPAMVQARKSPSEALREE